MKEKAIFKFNSGMGAILCSGCMKIIKTGNQFSDEERKALKGEMDLEAQYCEKCRNKNEI